MLNYKSYILNEASKQDKLKKKIVKWFPVEFVVDKAIDLHPKLAVWIVNQVINMTSEDYAKEKKTTPEKAKDYLLKNVDKSDKLFITEWKKHASDFGYIIDWVKSYGITLEDRQNFTKFTYDKAYQKSLEWHNSLKAGGEMDIEEDGDILIQFPDGFYWVDLGTSNSSEEADCMGHCGNTKRRYYLFFKKKTQ